MSKITVLTMIREICCPCWRRYRCQIVLLASSPCVFDYICSGCRADVLSHYCLIKLLPAQRDSAYFLGVRKLLSVKRKNILEFPQNYFVSITPKHNYVLSKNKINESKCTYLEFFLELICNAIREVEKLGWGSGLQSRSLECFFLFFWVLRIFEWRSVKPWSIFSVERLAGFTVWQSDVNLLLGNEVLVRLVMGFGFRKAFFTKSAFFIPHFDMNLFMPF